MTNSNQPPIPPGQAFGGVELPSAQSQKIGIKKVSTQKSIFDEMPKKPTKEEFEQKVQQVQEQKSGMQAKAQDLAIQFNRAMQDKTLPQNKNPFQKEIEFDILRGMVKFAQDANADPNAPEGEGSLSWIIILLKNAFAQRDKINSLEYSLSQLEKKLSTVPGLDQTAKSV
jgi:hypothetical protein